MADRTDSNFSMTTSVMSSDENTRCASADDDSSDSHSDEERCVLWFLCKDLTSYVGTAELCLTLHYFGRDLKTCRHFRLCAPKL